MYPWDHWCCRQCLWVLSEGPPRGHGQGSGRSGKDTLGSGNRVAGAIRGPLREPSGQAFFTRDLPGSGTWRRGARGLVS